jgi:hypothetical protein
MGEGGRVWVQGLGFREMERGKGEEARKGGDLIPGGGRKGT